MSADDEADAKFYMLFERAWKATDDRLLRLFCCACIRRLWRYLDAEGKRVLLTIEELCKSASSASPFAPTELFSLRNIYDDKSLKGEKRKVAKRAVFSCYGLQEEINMSIGSRAMAIATACALAGKSFEIERKMQCTFFEDLFKSPDERFSFAASPFNEQTLELASVAYDNCKVDTGEISAVNMKALGDAIQEGGDADPSIVSHCHSECSHIKGCWVLDLILGKR